MASEQTRGSVIVTGVAGGIGQALVKCFAEAGYSVIGTDKTDVPTNFAGLHYIRANLQQSVTDPEYASGVFERIRAYLSGQPLRALINNAAVQILGPMDNLTRENWSTTLDVNLLAPFFWAQVFLPELEACYGTVLNISSIHARLTKSNFIAYATSKAALSGLTRAMAVELGHRIRINAIEPAAIDTEMLRAGFALDPGGLEKLANHHPARAIGTPSGVAQLARRMVEMQDVFANGMVAQYDGGISFRLHDPSDD